MAPRRSWVARANVEVGLGGIAPVERKRQEVQRVRDRAQVPAQRGHRAELRVGEQQIAMRCARCTSSAKAGPARVRTVPRSRGGPSVLLTALIELGGALHRSRDPTASALLEVANVELQIAGHRALGLPAELCSKSAAPWTKERMRE